MCITPNIMKHQCTKCGQVFPNRQLIDLAFSWHLDPVTKKKLKPQGWCNKCKKLEARKNVELKKALKKSLQKEDKILDNNIIRKDSNLI